MSAVLPQFCLSFASNMADLSKGKISRCFTFSLIFCITLNGFVSSDRITEKIYKKIDQGFSCFRRLNGTHQIGCSCKYTFSFTDKNEPLLQ